MATNENLIPIPGRLHSVATEGHVAGANEIYDDNKGKLQSVINSEVDTELGNKIPTSQKGAAGGVASLDNSGKVPSGQLPSYVDDVIEGYYYDGSFYKEAAHTTVITGEEDKIYIDIPTSKSYRWSGSAYILISNPYSVDEEDLTVVNNNIKFKDRPNTDGMGKVILRKNVVSGVNTLTQSMMTQTNTIYVIQYDYVLGANITVPENCVLEFDGGSFRGNYSLIPNNTVVYTKGDNAIFNGISISTSSSHKFVNSTLSAKNFGFVSDRTTYPVTVTLAGNTYNLNAFGGTDNTNAFYRLRDFCNYSVNVKVCLDGYYYSQRGAMDINGASYMELYGGHHNMGLRLIDCHDCVIRNMSFYGYYEKHDFLYTTSDNWLNGIPVCGANAVTIYESVNRTSQDVIEADSILSYNNRVQDCYVEMRQGGFALGNMIREGDNRIINYENNSIIDNCYGTHLQYQLAGTHGVNCTISNCTANYVLQGYDISTGSINCTCVNCSTKKGYTGSKIGNTDSFNASRNSYVKLTEELTNDIQSNIERKGFWVYGQTYGSYFTKCNLTSDVTISEGIYIQSTSGYAKNIIINGSGKATTVIRCEALSSPILISDIDIDIDCTNIVYATPVHNIYNLYFHYSGVTSKTFKVIGKVSDSIFETDGTIDGSSGNTSVINSTFDCNVFYGKTVDNCLIKVKSTDDYCVAVNAGDGFINSKIEIPKGFLQLSGDFINNTFIWNDNPESVYIRKGNAAIGKFIGNTVISNGTVQKQLFAAGSEPLVTDCRLNVVDSTIINNSPTV